MMKRLLCLLVIAVMVLSVFAGCKKDGPETPGTSGESENTTEPVTNEPDVPKKTWNDLPKTKFDGEEYYILGRQHTPWGSFDLHAADTSTELSAAVFAKKWCSIFAVTSKSAITPSFSGGYATILPGVFPSMRFASPPTATTFLVSWFMATTEGSRRIIPLPFI